ncbi:FimB/Mfa2 family fimbrial subunit [Bacteroides sp. AN502(2024)]|uniref:FimB/Mfa2 family fimbrial subunit n=1 Tax=Bacteroides sp. AN502(2024) TaxID=3160599 RepID=UPI003512AC2B
MNMIPAYLKKTGRTVLAVMTLCCMMTSCDHAIYDDEGDCSVTYRVGFRYDRNMKWADAFAHEVKSVHLYAFDKSGTLVWQQSERGEALKADGYSMTLDLPAGDYCLIAWCGLENDGERAESFTVPEARVGVTRIEELQCKLNRQYDATGAAYSKEELYPLYHGMRNVTLPADDDGNDYFYTMDLTKDTNHVRVILQHLSGDPVDAKKFTFRIEEKNGWMNYDNNLLPDEMITYKAYNVKSDTASMGIDDYPEPGKAKNVSSSRVITEVSVAIADLTIARLMEDREAVLTIVANDDGHTVAQIPLTEYALLLKDGYGEEIGDQEYLDRQDEYALTFFLDEDRSWIGTSIIINSWKLVINKVDFGSDR